MSVTKFRNDGRPASTVRDYKGFNMDMTCRGFQYEVGKAYEMSGPIQLYEWGFHFCRKLSSVFEHYKGPDCRYAEIEAYGETINGFDRCVTNKIRIIRELTWEEVVNITNTGLSNSGVCNTGDCNAGDSNTGEYDTGSHNTGSFCAGNRNTGDCNIGDYNTGNNNSGDYNIGDCNLGDYNYGEYNIGDSNVGNDNTGDYNTGKKNAGNNNTGNNNSGSYNTGSHNIGDFNSGDWNIADHSTGFFNTVSQPMFMFNKPCEWTPEQFRDSYAGNILTFMPSAYTCAAWVLEKNMTDDEKEAYPEYLAPGGYLKAEDHKVDRQAWWDGLNDASKADVLALPNFDAEIFEKCTGIRV